MARDVSNQLQKKAVLLPELLAAVDPNKVWGNTDLSCTGLCYDSRRVQPGDVFFALPGAKTDGSRFVAEALERGALAVVAAPGAVSEQEQDTCVIEVANVRLAMARMAARYYGNPAQGIPVVGVTGTNGKTTVTYLLESILRQAGYRPAVLGTVAYRLGDEVHHPASHTTPESVELMALIADFRALGADALIMEVSSHALAQHRVDGLAFSVAVFTNLTPEHLDYHRDIEDYFQVKGRLFSELLVGGKAVINADDPYGRRLLALPVKAVAYGHDAACGLRPEIVTSGREGIHGNFVGDRGSVRIDSAMIGDFNVSNLLAAVAAGQQLDIANATIAAGVAAAGQVPGRLERVANSKGVLALVDYAHTGDALEQVLTTLVKLERGRLLTVVGCGGDRDPGKRPLMAAAAVKYSEVVIFTSDNPRTEDPLQILEQIRQGALAAGGQEVGLPDLARGARGFVVIPDRRIAIEAAVRLATAGDLLLVAGKGHEDYQILGTQRIHFDDREELQLAFALAAGDEADV